MADLLTLFNSEPYRYTSLFLAIYGTVKLYPDFTNLYFSSSKQWQKDFARKHDLEDSRLTQSLKQSYVSGEYFMFLYQLAVLGYGLSENYGLLFNMLALPAVAIFSYIEPERFINENYFKDFVLSKKTVIN